MSTGRRDADDDGPPHVPTIPGAWAAPAGALVDESSVVRPERKGDERPSPLRTAVLFVLLVLTAATFWGITVMVTGDDDLRAPVVSKRARVKTVAEVEKPVETAPAPPPSTPVVELAAADDGSAALVLEQEGVAPDAADSALDAPTGQPADEAPGAAAWAVDDDVGGGHVGDGDVGDGDVGDGDVGGDDRPPVAKRKAKEPYRKLPRKATKTSASPTGDVEGAAGGAPPDETPLGLVVAAEQKIARGALDAARRLVDKALALDPALARAHRARAAICARRGDSACARKAYEEYLRLAPNAPDAPDVRRVLGQ